MRKQPFSVVLLDEFEKAHANVWDLFLQVFDDGRLTDSLGHVADFRHCMIILTTNLGATSHRGSGLGFAPAADAFTGEQCCARSAQTFRPEFQNRLDKVIVFRPLTRDLMRDILKKELDRVLERRGLKDREWAVEWEASALEFLLEKGFSPEMGARPLKRAIDQYVIAPLAATIVEKRFPEGDQFVFVRSDGRAIQAEFVDPDGEAPRLRSRRGRARRAAGAAGDDPGARAAATRSCRRSPRSTTASADARLGGMGGAQGSGSSERMPAAGFWSRPDRHETLARLALMDRVQAAAQHGRVPARAASPRARERAGKSSRELVARLALQLHLVKEGIRDVFEAAPIEVALLVEPALERPGERRGDAAPGAGSCSTCIAPGPTTGTCSSPRLAGAVPRRPAAAADQRLRRASPAGAGGGPARAGAGADDEGRAAARRRACASPWRRSAICRPTSCARRWLRRCDRGPRPHAVVRRYRGESLAAGARHELRSWRSGRLDAVLRRRLRPDRGEPGRGVIALLRCFLLLLKDGALYRIDRVLHDGELIAGLIGIGLGQRCRNRPALCH